MDYAIRLDLKHDDDIPNFTALLTSLGGAYWVVREGGSTNPHIHCHFRCEKNIQCVRKSIIRKFPDHKGNGGYSIKVCDDDVTGYDRYMAKGESEGDDPITVAMYGLGFTSELVKEWHVEYWNVNQELMRKRRKKLVGSCIVDQLHQICLDKKRYKRGQIADEYLTLMVSANKAINIFAGKAAINTVWLKLCATDEARQVLLGELVGADADQARQ